jgi:SAM-dependent methyltransferase
MSFGAVADEYDRLRPGPPDAAIDWLLPPDCRVAVDLGAGTGLLTRALARKVPQVVAVEPDERMAAVLRERAAGGEFAGVRVAQGRGEAIPLPDASADGAFASSAWHWLDPERAPREIARVLRDGGRLGVIWTGRDRGTDWVREVESLGRRERPADDRDGQWPPHRREVSLPDDLFGDIETASFTFTRRMTVGDFVDMLATYSNAITASPQDRAAGLAHARAVLERRFPGATEIDVPMRSRCVRADRLPR